MKEYKPKNFVIAGDIECYGVSDKFICGCWTYRGNLGILEQPMFTNKKKYEQWIIDFAKKREHPVHAYFHNIGYDFFRYTDLENRLAKPGKEGYKIISLSRKPMIDYVDKNGETLIKFFDTYRLISRPLAYIGEKLGYPKLEPSETIQEKYKTEKVTPFSKDELEELMEYNKRDTEITLRVVEFVREMLNKEKYRANWLVTIGQLSMALFNKRLKAQGMKWTMMEWNDTPGNFRDYNKYYLTKWPEETRQAYKAGRIEALQADDFEECTNIDYNSLFPHAMMQMPFPNIKKEFKIHKPIETYGEKFLKSIGIAKCVLECPEQDYGYLPIRIKFGQHGNKEKGTEDSYIEETIYPKHECKLEGIWTNFEIKKALERGYKLIESEWTITYRPIKEDESPLKQFIQDCYNKRQEGEMQDFFYKYIMNNLHGKFAQRIREGEYSIDDVSKADDYVEKGFHVKTRFGFNNIYYKDTSQGYAKSFTPILSAYTTAYARDIIHNDMSNIPKEDMIYVATDGLLFKGKHIHKFDLGKEIGQYKIVAHEDEKLIDVPASVFGKNNYIVGKSARISGIPKLITSEMEPEEFKKEFEYWKFPTIDRIDNMKDMFIRKHQKKDLMGLRAKTQGLWEYIEEEKQFIDAEMRKGDKLTKAYNETQE